MMLQRVQTEPFAHHFRGSWGQNYGYPYINYGGLQVSGVIRNFNLNLKNFPERLGVVELELLEVRKMNPPGPGRRHIR